MELEIVFLPLPVIGHLKSTVELAKLLENEHFTITVLLMNLPIPSLESPITSYIQSIAAANPKIRFIDLPQVDVQFDEKWSVEASISLFIDEHKPYVKAAIKTQSSSSSSPSTRLSALIIDFFLTTMIDVATELGIPVYIFFTPNAASLSLLMYLPTLQVKVPCEFKDVEGEIEVPGLLPLPPEEMPLPVMNKKDEAYDWFVYHGRRFRETNGLIVNTFAELETTVLQAITDGQCLPDHHPTPPVYTVGPLLAMDKKPHEPQTGPLMQWLDQQPDSSVVFLCFGSMGSFPIPQIKEIAHGLEQSEHHFLWALRCRPSEQFGPPIDADLNELLPDGFLDRTRGRGLVWPSWVPQVDILGHAATGGFVSHCGWNSCLESIWFGVPMLAWPLYAEQRLNAFQMVHDYGLAVDRLDNKDDGLVTWGELEKGVRCLMGDSEKGMKVRKRAKEMQEASRRAMEQGGSSFSAMALLAEQLKKSVAIDH